MPHLTVQSLASFEEEVDYVPSKLADGIRKVYVTCKEDAGIPYEAQAAMAGAGSCEVVSIDCGHSPFLLADETQVLVKTVLDVAGVAG